MDGPEPTQTGQASVLSEVKYAAGWPKFARVPRRFVAALRSERMMRAAVVLAALVILYLRAPITFTHPQFWAEDADFFYFSRTGGFGSLTELLAGYLCTAQALVALVANCFNPEFAAAIYCYAAILITLGVVWLISSPRLDLPAKPLLAIAVVAGPPGFEVLGNLANSQWILAIGVFALLFMRPAATRKVIAAEAVLTGITAFTGPFAVYLTPLFVLRTYQAPRGLARNRMAVLAVLCFLGAATQILMIATHPRFAGLHASSPYPWTLWITVPFVCIVKAFGPILGFVPTAPGAGLLDAFGILFFAAAAVVLACLQPYRMQKLFMLFFGFAVAASGMWKNRQILDAIGLMGGARYFYIPDVLALWFVCCLGIGVYSRALVLTFVGASEILLLPAIAGRPRVPEDMAWPVWARLIDSGLPVLIPTAPAGGWSVHLPAAPNGPLAGYADWLGRPLAQMVQMAPPQSCEGSIRQIAAFVPPDLWTVSGTAWPLTDGPVRLVALADTSGIVHGFALPGFAAGSGIIDASAPPGFEAGADAPAGSGWNAVINAPPGTLLHGYAMLGDGRACPLAIGRYADVSHPVGGSVLFGAVPIVPGDDIVQAFKPLHRFDRLDVRFVAYARVASDYRIGWEIDSISPGAVLEIGSGTIDAKSIIDWQFISLPVSSMPGSVPGEAVLHLRAEGALPTFPAGVPLYFPAPGNSDPPASFGGALMKNGVQVNLIPDYVQ
jgi:hypothetical protein